MGWWFLLPIAGSAGVIYAVTSTSQTNQRPELPASTEVTHTWEAKLGDIDMKLNCTGGVDQFKDSVLSWKLSLNEDELSRMFYKGENIDKEVEMKLVSKDGIKLWPKNWTGIRVLRSQGGGSLSATYTQTSDSTESRELLTLTQGRYETQKVVCAWQELQKMQETEIYREGIQLGEQGLFASNQQKKLSLNISLGQCINSESRKETQCSLKIITKNAHLDWSDKISTKATLSLKQ